MSTNASTVAATKKVVCPVDENLLPVLRKLKSKEAFAVWKTLREKSPRVPKPKKIAKPLQPCRICGDVLVKRVYCSDACKQEAYRRRLNTPVAQMHRKEKAAAKQALSLRKYAYKSIGFDGRYSGPDRKEIPLHDTQGETLLHAVVRAIEVVNERAVLTR